MQLFQVTIVVRDYDEAIDFYVNKLGFVLIKDTVLNETKRWVVVTPDTHNGAQILLAKAAGEQQEQSIGSQTGGRVGFFLKTDNFDADYNRLLSKGVKFIREALKQNYGTIAVFEDLYGNLWDLIG